MRRALLVVAVIGAFVWLQIAKSVDESTSGPEKPQATSASPAVSASTDPPKLVSEKRAKMRLVRNFVPAFYDRDAQLYAGDAEERTSRFKEHLSPLVSTEFLENYTRPLTLPQEVELVQAGGSVVSHVVSFDGGHDEEVLVTIARLVTTDTGSPVKTVTRLSLTLTQVDDKWLVDSLTELF